MGLSKPGIIVDVVAFHKFVNPEYDDDSKPVHKCIKEQTLKLVYGDDEKSLKEIANDNRMSEMVSKLKKAGVAYQTSSKEKKKEIDENDKVINKIILKSDDTHIIAIALVEKKARLLFSVSGADRKLHKDFKNRNIIKNPRGKVYQEYKKHRKLLPKKKKSKKNKGF